MTEAKATKKDVAVAAKEIKLEVNGGVKWTFTDEEGVFSHTGVVIGLNDKYVDFVTKFGRVVARLTDGTFEVCQVTDTSLDTSVVSEMPKSTVTSARSGSKLDRAIALAKGGTFTRAQLKELYMKELNMTAAGAQTYVYNVQKILKEAATKSGKDTKPSDKEETKEAAPAKEKDSKEAAPAKDKADKSEKAEKTAAK